MPDQSAKIPLNENSQREKKNTPSQVTNLQEEMFSICQPTNDELRSNSIAPPSAKEISACDVQTDSENSHQSQDQQISFSKLLGGESDILQSLFVEPAEATGLRSLSDAYQIPTGTVRDFEEDVGIGSLTNTVSILEGLASKPNLEDVMLEMVIAVSKLRDRIDDVTKNANEPSIRAS